MTSATPALAGSAPARWRAAAAFVVEGLVAIIAGGLVAAVTGPAGLADGSWAAAYLVLVAGSPRSRSEPARHG